MGYKRKNIDSLISSLKESIPNIGDLACKINLEIYDASTLSTHVLSNTIEDTGDNLYADNTYTIIYDPEHDCSLEEVASSYYTDNMQDLTTVVSYFLDNIEMFSHPGWAYDELVDPDLYGRFDS